MNRVAVLNVVGLTRRLIGSNTPSLSRLADKHPIASIGHVFPAVTCSVQATYLTGAWPSQHGIVGNGWYFRDECEVKFWRQSNKLVQGRKIWEIGKERNPAFICANLFWWYNMYSNVDYAITPRPMYPADGRKIPDVYAQPEELRQLQDKLGTFPLFNFWGPNADIRSTQWIADAAIETDLRYSPTLSLVYLPHLDYCLQKYGPGDARVGDELRAVDQVVGKLCRHLESRQVRVVILSEYGIVPVRTPVHINRYLRNAGLLRTRDELGRDNLDAGASEAFAVADHQVAHVYVRDPARIGEIRQNLQRLDGIAEVLDEEGKRRCHLDHPRAGELIALARPDAWFTYYFWLDDRRAPDYARTVDIHRKPGYDPVELFLDPAIRHPRLTIGRKLAARKLGFRNLLDVIPLDATLVRGSHGVEAQSADDAPIYLGDAGESPLTPTSIGGRILQTIFGA